MLLHIPALAIGLAMIALSLSGRLSFHTTLDSGETVASRTVPSLVMAAGLIVSASALLAMA